MVIVSRHTQKSFVISGDFPISCSIHIKIEHFSYGLCARIQSLCRGSVLARRLRFPGRHPGSNLKEIWSSEDPIGYCKRRLVIQSVIQAVCLGTQWWDSARTHTARVLR